MARVREYVNNVEIKSIEDFENININEISKKDDIEISINMPIDSDIEKQIFTLAGKIDEHRPVLDKLADKRKRTVKFIIATNTEDKKNLDALTAQQADKFKKLEEKLSKINSQLRIKGREILDDMDYIDYSIDEVISAQNNANTFVDKVKNSGLSPFEKYLMIYDFVTNRIYNEVDENESKQKSRNLISVLSQKENIVCVGYAEMLSYLCNKVGIKCFAQDLSASGRDNNHRNNVVVIHDDKYNIHGTFYADACWDSYRASGKYKTLCYSLLPLVDKQHIKSGISDTHTYFSSSMKASLEFLYKKDFAQIYNGVMDIMKDYSFEQNLDTYFEKGKFVYQMSDKEITDFYKIGKESENIFDEPKYKSVEEARKNSTNIEEILAEFDNSTYNIEGNKEKLENIVHDKERMLAAIDLLKTKFEEQNVPDNIYNTHGIPKSLSIESLLVLCALKPPQENMVEENIKTLLNRKIQDKTSKYGITKTLDELSADIENDFISSNLKDAFKASMITGYLASNIYEKQKTKNRTAPKMLDFLEAQTNVNMANGMDQQKAAERAFLNCYNSVVQANESFSISAENVFSLYDEKQFGKNYIHFVDENSKQKA